MENERKERVVDMYLVEVEENACMTKADIRRILDHLAEDEIFPMECFARKNIPARLDSLVRVLQNICNLITMSWRILSRQSWIQKDAVKLTAMHTTDIGFSWRNCKNVCKTLL